MNRRTFLLTTASVGIGLETSIAPVSAEHDPVTDDPLSIGVTGDGIFDPITGSIIYNGTKDTLKETEGEPTEEPIEDEPAEEPVEDGPTEEPIEDEPTEEPIEDEPTEEPIEDEPTERSSPFEITVDGERVAAAVGTPVSLETYPPRNIYSVRIDPDFVLPPGDHVVAVAAEYTVHGETRRIRSTDTVTISPPRGNPRD